MSLKCTDYFKPCSPEEQASFKCVNEGLCCVHGTSFQCICATGWTNKYCQDVDIEAYIKRLESLSQPSMMMMASSTVVSLCVAVIALIALSVIIFILVKRSKKRTAWNETQARKLEKLSRSISQVQVEIEKLPKADKLNNINRLTKLVEVSCLTGGAVLLKNPYVAPNPPPTSRACLPRWSSAPDNIVFDQDTTDSSLLTAERRKRLQQVLSLPEVH